MNKRRIALVVTTAALGVAGLATAGTAQAAPAGPGVVVDYAAHTVKVRPASFQPYKDVNYTSVKWTALTSTTGDATAIRNINTCVPACAAGHYQHTRVKLHFTNVKVSDGRRVFTRAQVTDLATKKTTTTALPVFTK
ncbi:hypothetical protein [Actinoplanes sp. NPDC048796]|uniref:hypothetical protein n=1 Tax=unclassified Actinoplanes TaxID=2626549 RepID=UPI0033FC4D5C